MYKEQLKKRADKISETQAKWLLNELGRIKRQSDAELKDGEDFCYLESFVVE